MFHLLKALTIIVLPHLKPEAEVPLAPPEVVGHDEGEALAGQLVAQLPGPGGGGRGRGPATAPSPLEAHDVVVPDDTAGALAYCVRLGAEDML